MKRESGFFKTLRYICLISILILGLLTIVGTGGGGDDGGGNAGDKAILSDNAVALDDETNQKLVSASPDNSSLTFESPTTLLEELEVDDVIAVGVTEETPYGLLRKVTSKSYSGNQVIVETTQAKLTDAIEQGVISISKTLNSSDLDGQYATVKAVQGVTVKDPSMSRIPQAIETQGIGDDELFNLGLDDVVLYDHDGNEETTYDQIIANGDISFGLSFDFDIEVDDWKIQSLNFTTTPWQCAEIIVDSSVSCYAEYKKQIYQHSLPVIKVVVGSWPVYITPVVTVSVGIDGSVCVGVSTGITESTEITAGLVYQSSTWSPVSDYDVDFDYLLPDISTSASFEGYIEPDLALLIYGVTGPYSNLKGYLVLDADIDEDPWWKLYAGISLGAGVRVEVLGHEIINYNIPDIIDYQRLLVEADGPYENKNLYGLTYVSSSYQLRRIDTSTGSSTLISTLPSYFNDAVTITDPTTDRLYCVYEEGYYNNTMYVHNFLNGSLISTLNLDVPEGYWGLFFDE